MKKILISAIALLAGSAAHAQTFYVYNPEYYHNATYTRAIDLSNDGFDLIGLSNDGAGLRSFHSQVAQQGGVLIHQAQCCSYPTAISGNGANFFGYENTNVFTLPFGWTVGPRAFRANVSGNGITPVPMFPWADFSDAGGISDNADIVVGRQFTQSSELAYRFSYSTYQLEDLGTLPAQFGAAAMDVSGDASTVVGRSGSLAFKWRQSEGMMSLGSLPGQVSAVATCVSQNGLAIAGTSNNGVDRGFYWSPIAGMQQLPMLAGGVELRPMTMAGAGQIIGGRSIDAAGNPTAFIWTPTLGTMTLAAHLVGRGLSGQLQNVVFTDVTGISLDGRYMCGLGIRNGVEIGWGASNLQCGTLGGTNGTQLVCAGGNINIIANGITGGPAGGISSFQWYKNNVLIVEGFQPGGSHISLFNPFMLYLSGATALDTGDYYCIASSAGACPHQGPTTNLQIQPVPSVTLQPVHTMACSGDTATFTAAGGGVNAGTLSYQWFRLNGAIVDGPSGLGSTYAGGTTPQFQIINCSPMDFAWYRCRISNSCGEVLTEYAPLTVHGPVTVWSNPAPVYTCNSGNAVFSFNVTGASSIHWEWFNGTVWNTINNGFMVDLNTGVAWIAATADTTDLQLSGIEFGPFTSIPVRCVVSNPCYSVFPIETTLNRDYPVTLGIVNDQYFCHYTPANFSASVLSGNSFQYQWQMQNPIFFTWTDLPNGYYVDSFTGITANISGATSLNMSFDIIEPQTSPNYLYFRCAVLGPCGWQYPIPGTMILCRGDFNCDGSADFFDYLDFVDAYSASFPNSDFNGDGNIDFFDYLDFVDAFSAGC